MIDVLYVRDASIMLAKMELNASAVEGLGVNDLTPAEVDALNNWVRCFPCACLVSVFTCIGTGVRI